jgi:acetyl esterase/lipase
VQVLTKRLLRRATQLAVISLFFGGAALVIQTVMIFPGAGSLFFRGDMPSPPPPIEGVTLESSDGTHVDLWSLKADTAPRKAFLYFHGNGITLARSVPVLKQAAALGFSAFALDYRGYGRSGGWPTESGLYDDAEAAWRYVTETAGFAPSDVVILGHSLGTAPASYIAAHHHVGALLLVSPFTSVPDVAQTLPYLRYLRWFIWEIFPTESFARTLKNTCAAVFATKEDTIVPFEQSKQVAKSLPGAVFRLISGTNHFAIVFDALRELPKEVARCGAPPALP